MADKFQSFNRLKDIAGSAYADRFIAIAGSGYADGFIAKDITKNDGSIATSTRFVIDLSGTACAQTCPTLQFECPNYPLEIEAWLSDPSDIETSKLQQYALTLFGTRVSDPNKIEAFKGLSELVSEDHKEKFTIHEDTDGIKYTLDLSSYSAKNLNGYESFSL